VKMCRTLSLRVLDRITIKHMIQHIMALVTAGMDYDGGLTKEDNLRDARRIDYYQQYLSGALEAIRYDVLFLLSPSISSGTTALKCGSSIHSFNYLKSQRKVST
jgi:hypothetical protein